MYHICYIAYQQVRRQSHIVAVKLPLYALSVHSHHCAQAYVVVVLLQEAGQPPQRSGLS